MFSTRDGRIIPPYDILPNNELDPIDIYVIHRGPDTKEGVVVPLAHTLERVGVKCFADVSSKRHSMPLGQDKHISMQKGLSACRYALLLLSDGFCDSKDCVRETNTILKREQDEGRNILIPAFYTGSRTEPPFSNLHHRSALVRTTESATEFALKLVRRVLQTMGRPVPDIKRLRFLMNEILESSHSSISEDVYVATGSSLRSIVSSLGDSVSTQMQWKTPSGIPVQFCRGSIGREDEINDITNMLWGAEGHRRGSSRCAALWGSAGIGKTSLAALFADSSSERYPGGLLWLSIGPQRTTSDDAIQLLQSMVTKCYVNHSTSLQDPPVYTSSQVHDLLALRNSPGLTDGYSRSESPLLVVFDDVWGEEILETMKEAVPVDCHIVMTTRDRDVAFELGQGEDSIYEVGALSMDDSVDLLQTMVRQLQRDTAVDIARAIGCHPQALSVVAGALSRGRHFGHNRIAQQIIRKVLTGRGFSELKRPNRKKGKTPVEKALDKSYEAMQDFDNGSRLQKCFRGLAVFAQEASFSSEAAAFVWNEDNERASSFLSRLESQALLRFAGVDENDTDTDSTTRWVQHAVVRNYQYELWMDHDVNHNWHRRHADYYLQLVEKSNKQKPRAFHKIDMEFAQIQHAFTWSEQNSPTHATKLAIAMTKYLNVRGRIAKLESWLLAALSIAEKTGDSKWKAAARRSLGDLYLQLGDVAAASTCYDEALVLFRETADKLGEANTFHSIGDLVYRLGDVAGSREKFASALVLFEQVKDTWGIATALRSLGDVARFIGNDHDARLHFKKVLPYFEESANLLGQAGMIQSWGKLEARVGNLKEASNFCERALVIYTDCGSQLGRANSLKMLGDIELRSPHLLKSAQSRYEEALELFQLMKDELGIANVVRALGDISISHGDLPSARTFFEQSLVKYDTLGNSRGRANCHRGLGIVNWLSGNTNEAAEYLKEASAIFQVIRAKMGVRMEHTEHIELDWAFEGSEMESPELCMTQQTGRAQTLDILSEVER